MKLFTLKRKVFFKTKEEYDVLFYSVSYEPLKQRLDAFPDIERGKCHITETFLEYDLPENQDSLYRVSMKGKDTFYDFIDEGEVYMSEDAAEKVADSKNQNSGAGDMFEYKVKKIKIIY